MNSRRSYSSSIFAKSLEGKCERREESLMYYLWQQTSSYAALVQPTSLQGDAVPVFAGSLVVLLHTFLPHSSGARVTSEPPVQSKNVFANLLLQVSGVSRLPLTAAGEEASRSQPGVGHCGCFVRDGNVRGFPTPSLSSCSTWEPQALFAWLQWAVQKSNPCWQQGIGDSTSEAGLMASGVSILSATTAGTRNCDISLQYLLNELSPLHRFHTVMGFVSVIIRPP